MKIRQITEEEMSARLKRPYNPPTITNNAEEIAFYSEWCAAQEKVDSCLRGFGERDDSGCADYCLSTDWCPSRGIGVTVTRKGFLTVTILNALGELLCDFEKDYEIYATHFMDGEERWQVLIDSQECAIFARSVKDLAEFGAA